jgi:hypothetical protein
MLAEVVNCAVSGRLPMYGVSVSLLIVQFLIFLFVAISIALFTVIFANYRLMLRVRVRVFLGAETPESTLGPPLSW